MIGFISVLAETNRAPFDLTKGERKLVTGFNTEYTAGPLALFFLAEWDKILLKHFHNNHIPRSISQPLHARTIYS